MDIWFFPQVYPMKDNAATNILLHISWYMCLRIFLRYMPRGGIAKMSITCMFNFTLACLMPKDFLFFSFFLSFFFFFWLHWVFFAVHGLSLVVASGGYSLLWCMGFHCSGFSCCGARALDAQASAVAARRLNSCSTWALEHMGFSSCGTRAQ